MNTENTQPDPMMDADLNDALSTRMPEDLVDHVFDATAESLPQSEALQALDRDLTHTLHHTAARRLEERLFCATAEALPRDAVDQGLERDLAIALRAGTLPAELNPRIEQACQAHRARLKNQPTILARLGSWGFSSAAAALVLVSALWALRPAPPMHTDVVAVLEAIHQLENTLPIPSDALANRVDNELLTLRMEIEETELGLSLDRMNDALGHGSDLLGRDLDLLELELDAMF